MRDVTFQNCHQQNINRRKWKTTFDTLTFLKIDKYIKRSRTNGEGLEKKEGGKRWNVIIEGIKVYRNILPSPLLDRIYILKRQGRYISHTGHILSFP